MEVFGCQLTLLINAVNSGSVANAIEAAGKACCGPRRAEAIDQEGCDVWLAIAVSKLVNQDLQIGKNGYGHPITAIPTLFLSEDGEDIPLDVIERHCHKVLAP